MQLSKSQVPFIPSIKSEETLFVSSGSPPSGSKQSNGSIISVFGFSRWVDTPCIDTNLRPTASFFVDVSSILASNITPLTTSLRNVSSISAVSSQLY